MCWFLAVVFVEDSRSKYIKALVLLVSSPAVANRGCCGCQAASTHKALAKLKLLCIFLSLQAWSQTSPSLSSLGKHCCSYTAALSAISAPPEPVLMSGSLQH